MIVFYNGRIVTMDPDQPTANAMAIEGNRVLALGGDQQILAEFGNSPRKNQPFEIHDLNGHTILPGLTDAHVHLSHYALGLQNVDCETETREECLRRVAERALNTPTGEWVFGHGWNQNNWPEGFGNAADLDRVIPHHPVFLTAKSLHAAWANTNAMRLAGINDSTPDPEGGQLLRDASGAPTGIFLEAAMDLIRNAIPEAGVERTAQAIQAALPDLWSMGLTGAHDFDGNICFAALQILRAEGSLLLRVVKSIPLEKLPQAIEIGLRSGFGDEFLRVGSVKAFADGALGPQTAAMLQPYKERPEAGDGRGLLLLDAEELFEHGRQAVGNGLSLAVHAIGDRANHAVLDAFEHLRAYEQEEMSGDRPLLRHRIEHVQLLHPGDVHRLAMMNVTASMQPIHATSDMLMADRHWGERAAFAYAWRSQLEQGAVLAFGSDAPVESPNPFWGLHAAVTRQRQDGSPGPEGWYPEQRISLGEAFQAYTSGPALAAGLEGCLGKLAPGYFADLLILEQDPFECQADQLYHLRPSATMVGGEWVYRE